MTHAFKAAALKPNPYTQTFCILSFCTAALRGDKAVNTAVVWRRHCCVRAGAGHARVCRDDNQHSEHEGTITDGDDDGEDEGDDGYGDDGDDDVAANGTDGAHGSDGAAGADLNWRWCWCWERRLRNQDWFTL